MKKVVLATIFILLTTTFIYSNNKYALVIGNSNYSSSLGALKNPINDAKDIAYVLEKTDFKVSIITNGSRKEIMEGVRNFQNRIQEGDTALFYYSGHGVQVNGKNYLIPVEADLVYESDAEFEAVEMDYILSSLEKSGSSRNIIIFDACRNNDLKKDSKSVTRGLAVVHRKLPESIIIYSTSPGEVAMDGKGRNSPFATSLINNIRTPNQSLNSLVMKITKDVKNSTGFQTPWRTSSLSEEFYFVKNTSYNKPANNFTFENVELFGSLQITVENPGDLYLDGSKIKSFKSGESSKIPKLTTGSYSLEFRSNSKRETITITITEDSITKVKFIGEAAQKAILTKTIISNTKRSSTGIDLILVEAGTFNMGSTNGDSDEKPVRSVTITKDYYIGKYEVTQKQWKAVMGSNPSRFIGDNLPVEKVSWYETVKFCNKLSQKEGLTPAYTGSGDNIEMNPNANGYRLPTEAEWEYAAKGGNKSRDYTYSGSNSVDIVAWYSKTTNDNGTKPVGTKQANELGIYDMSGNVCEWCYDWKLRYSDFSQRDPIASRGFWGRVRRGGGWGYDASNARSANRDSDGPGYWGYDIGFRLVLPVQ